MTLNSSTSDNQNGKRCLNECWPLRNVRIIANAATIQAEIESTRLTIQDGESIKTVAYGLSKNHQMSEGNESTERKRNIAQHESRRTNCFEIHFLSCEVCPRDKGARSTGWRSAAFADELVMFQMGRIH